MIVMLGVSDGKIILGLLSLIRERETNKSRNVNNDHTKERKREDRGYIKRPPHHPNTVNLLLILIYPSAECISY